MKQLIDYFADKKVKTVLDVGTGPGNFIKVLEEVFPDAVLIGADPDKDALAEARKNFPAIRFEEMKGEKLDFANASFDVASISMALHHLSDVQQTLQEMQRVVHPGGWLIISELVSDGLNPAQEVHKQMHHFRSTIDRLNGICHHSAFTRKEIVEKVKNTGLKIVLQFENQSEEKEPTLAEISERKQKLYQAVETIKDKPEYGEMIAQIPALESALEQHGFSIAPRLVLVCKAN